MREQRRKSTDITGGGDSAVASGCGMAATQASGSMAIAEDVDVCTGPGDMHSVSEPSIELSSQSDQADVDDDGEVRPPVKDDSCLFVQVASLKNVVKNILCPICQGDLTVVVVDKKKGLVVGLRTECTSCGHIFSETLSSGKIGDRGSQSPFATTRRLVAGNVDCGVGFSGLRQICW